MKLANFEREGLVRAGLVKGEIVFDISEEAAGAGVAPLKSVTSVDQLLDESLLEPIRRAEAKLTAGRGVPIGSVTLRSPVMYPEKILCVAVNYGAHSKEEKVAPPAYPYYFTKFRNCLVGPEEPVVIPRVSKMVDWEVELAVVIGREGKDIRREDAYSYVAGYTISNDISYRDHQFPPGWPEKKDPLGLNWLKGKGMDKSFPLGPWIVTKDEIPDPQNLAISLSVNGTRRQASNTGDMLIAIDSLISYASIGMTLRPGDIISTGTPMGVAHGTGAPYLQDGDVMEATIEGIGTLRNPVVAERQTS